MARPTARSLLETLNRDRLLEVAAGLDIPVKASWAATRLIDTLVDSRKVRPAELIGTWGRDELKEACRRHGLPDHGKRKDDLVARLLEGAEAEPKPSGPGGRAPARAAAGREPDPAPSQPELPLVGGPDRKLTVDELERKLWSAADILRGSIDASDYKHYIFGLLFLKRLSDRYMEEVEALLARGFPKKVAYDDRDYHEFTVPQGARWSDLIKHSEGIGEQLNIACAALEDENPPLRGVLRGIDFNDPMRLGDTRNRDTVLGKLIQHFARLSLRNADLSEPDILGRAYEYLIERFADDAGKKGGEFYTPTKVAELMARILAPRAGMTICDPTCGSGGMLLQCAKVAAEAAGGRVENLALHGQEKNLGTWAICKMNMLLHGHPSARIEKGDTIRAPALLKGGNLHVYDRVIANPPFSLDQWGHEEAEGDRHGRFRFGIPPKSKGDFAFVQHMIAVLKPGGEMAVVMPHGVLFRGGSEATIREGILGEDLLEAVIGLPANLFYGTGIPAAILVLRRQKPPERAKKVLFIDASRDFEQGTNQNKLRDQDVTKIVAAFHTFADLPRYARVVALGEIKGNEYNLNITRYVDTSEEETEIDLRAAIAKLRELEKARADAEAVMNGYLKELGYE